MTNVKNAQSAKIDLSKYKELLKGRTFDTIKGEKNSIYNYAANNIHESDINERKGKQFRAKCRTTLKRYSDNILSFAVSENIERLKTEIESFDIWYQQTFTSHNYKIDSITNRSEDKAKYRDTVLMLEIINKFKS